MAVNSTNGKFWNISTVNVTEEKDSLPFFNVTDNIADLVTFIVSLILGALGLVGNSLTMIKVKCDKKLHTPTYTSVASLALADSAILVVIMLTFYTNILNRLPATIAKYVTIDFCVNTTGANAIFNMMLICGIRYHVTVYPFESRTRLSCNVVMRYSILSWLTSIIFGATFLLIKFYRPLYAILTVTVAKAIMTLIAVGFVIVLHCLKMRTLQSSTVNPMISNRMSRNITIIIIIFIVYSVLGLVSLVHWYIYWSDASSTVITYIGWFTRLSTVFNHSCNPYIYFISSPACKMCDAIVCKVRKNQNRSPGPSTTILASSNNSTCFVISD